MLIPPKFKLRGRAFFVLIVICKVKRRKFKLKYIIEKPSEENFIKFNLKEVIKKHYLIDLNFEWIFCEEKQSYLLNTGSSHEEPFLTEFLLFWNGKSKYYTLSSTSESSNQTTYHRQWSLSESSRFFTEKLKSDEIKRQMYIEELAALKAALTTYTKGEIITSNITVEVSFDF